MSLSNANFVLNVEDSVDVGCASNKVIHFSLCQ